MPIKDSSSAFLPAFSNINPINDTKHPELQVKTGQNRPPLQRSASLSRAADSPECWWDGKLTETKVAISDSDRCLLECVGFRRSTEFLFLSMWPCVYYMSLHVWLYTDQQVTHPSLHRGVAQWEDWPMHCEKGRQIFGSVVTLFVSGDA